METSRSTSSSLLSDLCREIEFIKVRTLSINQALENCRSEALIRRLKKELLSLKIRKHSIAKLSSIMGKKLGQNNLSINLLNEVIGRSLSYK